MEWLWSVISAVGGWLLGHWQSTQERKQGIEEGAQAAFAMEIALLDYQREHDRERLKKAFQDVDLSDTKQVHDVAQVVGGIYAEIIRRDAFSDARFSNFSPHDRESWQRAFDEDMPPVGYEQGYLQGIRDILKGASQAAPEILDTRGLVSFETWAKKERNAGFGWIDGKSIGRLLMIFPFNLSNEKTTGSNSTSAD